MMTKQIINLEPILLHAKKLRAEIVKSGSAQQLQSVDTLISLIHAAVGGQANFNDKVFSFALTALFFIPWLFGIYKYFF